MQAPIHRPLPEDGAHPLWCGVVSPRSGAFPAERPPGPSPERRRTTLVPSLQLIRAGMRALASIALLLLAGCYGKAGLFSNGEILSPPGDNPTLPTTPNPETRSCGSVSPGHVSIHRLTNDEYNNT